MICRAIARSSVRDLTLVTYGGPDVGLLCAAGKVRKEAYGTARPQCASNLIGVPRLAFPEQLIEITFKAMLSGAEAKPR